MRRPSGDQAGSPSASTLASRKRSDLVATSYTAMNAWSSRSLTNASVAPSGDQRSERADPRAWISCSPCPDVSPSEVHHTWPWRTNATRSPLGDTAGACPSLRRRGVPPVAATIHTACSTPVTRLCGFGYSPLPFGPPPRTYTIARPSGAQRRSVSS